MEPLRVIIADDHQLFRQGLISLMKTRPEMVDVIGEAENGREAVALAAELQPDIVLMDIDMPIRNGIEAAEIIRREHPEIKVVMLTASELDDDLYHSVKAGAAGYLLKNLDADDLFSSLRGVVTGEAAITRTMAARLLKNISMEGRTVDTPAEELTDREIDVLRLVAIGASNREIAESLSITPNTVKTHLRHILEKLQLDNRTQAATYAVRAGLVAPH